MGLTYSPEDELGKQMSAFSLPTVDGQNFNSQSIEAASAKIVAFICAHCPYVLAIEERLIQLATDLKAHDIPFVAICSNDSADFPEDAPEALRQRALEKSYSFPYLVDEDQTIAKNYEAVCTPDFFVYGSDNKLAYRGRLDDSWKDPSKVTRRELFEATLAIAQNKKPHFDSRPTMGCSIKWK